MNRLPLVAAASVMVVACIAGICPAHPPSDEAELPRRIEEASRRLEKRPSDASLFVERARLFHARGQWIDMKRDLDRAVELAPRDAVARGMRGLANALLGDEDRALSDVDAAISLDPHSAYFLGLRGSLLLNMGRTADAIASLDRSIAIEPTARVHFDRGFCHQLSGDLQASIDDYSAAYRLDSNLLAAVRERGHSHQRAGNFARAVEDFELCRGREPHEPTTELSLAWLLATCPDEGIRNGRRALMIAGDLCDPVTCRTVEPLNALAAAYAELGEFEKAEALQERAFSLSYFAPEFHEVCGRRLKAIRDRRPIREANVPLTILPRFQMVEPPAVDPDHVTSSPADVLALGYLETVTLLGNCPIARAGATVNGSVDGQPITIDASNADRVVRRLEERRSVFANAIRARGHATLSAGYTSRAEGGCVEWGLDGNRVLIEQDGFDLHITEGGVRHAGVVVGSCVAFVHDMNTTISISGTISGDTITFTTAQRGGVTGMATERCQWALTSAAVEGPEWAEAFAGRALAHRSYENDAAAVSDLERSLALKPDADIASVLAFILATTADRDVRDGRYAVRMAERAVTLAGGTPDGPRCAVLAVAHAEAGNFPEAVRYQKLTLEKPPPDASAAYFAVHRERLRLFEKGQPFREEQNPSRE